MSKEDKMTTLSEEEYMSKMFHKLGFHFDLFNKLITVRRIRKHGSQVCYICNWDFECYFPHNKGLEKGVK